MAHALFGHDGPCKNIHGHSYVLSVTLKGRPVKDPQGSKTGMVMDFTDLKKIVSDTITGTFDHALVLNKNTPPGLYAGLNGQKLILVGFQPTCENLVLHFAEKLRKSFGTAKLHHLRLEETSTSYAEWYAEDNT